MLHTLVIVDVSRINRNHTFSFVCLSLLPFQMIALSDIVALNCDSRKRGREIRLSSTGGMERYSDKFSLRDKNMEAKLKKMTTTKIMTMATE